jgi:hypothetical protein
MPDPSPQDLPDRADPVARLTGVLLVPGVLLAVLVLLIRAATHAAFYDECLHARMLWLISAGLVPHEDFWCNYPTLGYLLSLPLFRALPDSAYALLVLRFGMVLLGLACGVVLAAHGRRHGGHVAWGLAPWILVLAAAPFGRFLVEYSIDHFAAVTALGAFVLSFRGPSPTRVTAAVALGCLSVLFTPKYALPLALGLGGFTVAAILETGRPRAVLLAAGGAVLGVVLATSGLYAVAGLSFPENVSRAHLFMARFKLSEGRAVVTLGESLLDVLVRHWPLASVLVLGLAGWAVHHVGRLRTTLWGPLGILVGTALSTLMLRTFLEQYLLPVVAALVLFVPFASVLARRARLGGPAAAVLALATLVAAGWGVRDASTELERTPVNLRDENGLAVKRCGLLVVRREPFLGDLRSTVWLLDRIPSDERVVATGVHHPLWRRDLTFITADESPSFLDSLPPADPSAAYFLPSYFHRRLREQPPAYIALDGLEITYPDGWRRVCEEFLEENRSRYVDISGVGLVFLRKDLVPEDPGARPSGE